MSKPPKKIQQCVSKILSDNRVHRPPVPVEKIAQNYGIEVRYEPAEDELSGALIRKSDEVVIGVNSSHHPNRQRFTIAHEIAHFLLHKGVEVHVDQDFRVNLRDQRSSEAVSRWEEIEANRFAAELLMPTDFITRDARRFEVFDDDVKQRLANRYRVSKHAMGLRLADLGVDSPV